MVDFHRNFLTYQKQGILFLNELYLDYYFIFLRLSLIKPNELLDFLTNINPAIPFAMEKSDTQLPLPDIMINKKAKKFFMGIYSKPTNSKDISPSNQTTPSIV